MWQKSQMTSENLTLELPNMEESSFFTLVPPACSSEICFQQAMCVHCLLHARHFKDTTSPNPQGISVKQTLISVIWQTKKLGLRGDLLKGTQLVCVLLCVSERGWNLILNFSASPFLITLQMLESSIHMVWGGRGPGFPIRTQGG